MKIIAGGSNPEFAQKVAEQCFTDLVPTDVTRFSDGEILVEIKENNNSGLGSLKEHFKRFL